MPTAPSSPALDALLARRPDELQWLGPAEIAGFFFALGAAPQLVPPSEWMDLIFGGEGPEAESIEELNAAVQPLFELYDEAMGLARNPDDTGLPPWLMVRSNPVDNVGGEAPLAGWSRGFRYGHLWLEELWDVPLPDDVEEEYASALVSLSFFGLDEGLPDMLRQMGADEARLPEVAGLMIHALPDAMAAYAALGRTLEEVLGTTVESPDEPAHAWSADGVRASTPAASTSAGGPWAADQEVRASGPGPIGENDPCPCRSGQRYKRCCGRMVH